MPDLSAKLHVGLQLPARHPSSISNSAGPKLDSSVFFLFCWVSGFHGRHHHSSGASSVKPTTLNPVSLSVLPDFLSCQLCGVFHLWSPHPVHVPLFPCALPMLAQPLVHSRLDRCNCLLVSSSPVSPNGLATAVQGVQLWTSQRKARERPVLFPELEDQTAE